MRSQRVQLRQVVVGVSRREEHPLHAVEDAEHRVGKAVGTEIGRRFARPCDQLVADLAASSKRGAHQREAARRGAARVSPGPPVPTRRRAHPGLL